MPESTPAAGSAKSEESRGIKWWGIATAAAVTLLVAVIALRDSSSSANTGVMGDVGAPLEIELDGEKPWDVEEEILAEKAEKKLAAKVRGHSSPAHTLPNITGKAPKQAPKRIRIFEGDAESKGGVAKLKAATGLSVVSSNKTRLSKFKFYETPLKNQFKQNEPETGAFAHSMLNRHIPKARHATTPTQSGAAVVPSVVRGQKIVPMVVFKLAQTSSLSFTSLMNLQPSVHMDKELVPPKDGSIMKDSQRQQMQTMLRDTIKDPAASLAKLSKGKNNDTSDIANFEVYGAQINPKKTPFINFKYVLNSGTRPASLVVFVRSNMVKYAVSLWNEKLLTQSCSGKATIGASALLDKDAVVDLQAASISGTRSRQLKKDDKKDNKKDDKKDDKKDTNATNATSTKKDDKKKDDKKKDDKKKCLKVKMPVEEFEKRLRDAFWKVGTMIGVAILTEVDFYEVTYEDLQADAVGTIRGVMEYLGKGSLFEKKPVASMAVVKNYIPLHDVLTNYAEIEGYLKKNAPCLLPQLDAKVPTSFAPCPNPFKFSDNELDDALMHGVMKPKSQDAKKAFKEVIKPQLKFQNHTKPADKKKDDKKDGKKKNDKKDDKKDDKDSTGSTGDKSKDSDVKKTASVGGK